MKLYQPDQLHLTKYLFFTGKGGVGKTTTACATAMNLADRGFKVVLVSTDPASNLQDVFETELTNQLKSIEAVPNLSVANFDPVTAAEAYKEQVIGPYRGVLPDSALENMAEQLSGSCTVEIAAFNEFANFLTDPTVSKTADYIIFDTAPTGHTLRMLQLPSAWSNYLDENSTGASCLGQLSGLGEQKSRYEQAVKTLGNAELTTLMLVTRPQKVAMEETKRASAELSSLGMNNQNLIINGVFENWDDELSKQLYQQQQSDLATMPAELKQLTQWNVPLRAYNVTGVDKLRILLNDDQPALTTSELTEHDFPTLATIVDNFIKTDKKLIFTMGKGGVGKTTVAIQIAKQLARQGKRVRLASTDPADHLNLYLKDSEGIAVSHIDEEQELKNYQNEVLDKARQTMNNDDVAYIEEDLRSPCTQEIAVFRAFAEIVDKSADEVVVIDTAPTGHTLLLLDSTQSYAQELKRSAGEVPVAIQKLLPRLQNQAETEVLMVTLPETTPVYESMRLNDDLKRAKIAHTWWLVNQSMYASHPTNAILQARAANEIKWIKQVDQLSKGHFAVAKWNPNFETELR
jgi:arsenite-transporting ATPase